MYNFSRSSAENLDKADSKLQIVLIKAIKYVDFSIVYTFRTPQEQFELYKKGREERDGHYIIVKPNDVVTQLDGITKKSKHNMYPSQAFDFMPYPLSNNSKIQIEQYCYIAGIMKAIALENNIKIRWGRDWNNDNNFDNEKFLDYAHFEL